MLQLMIIIVSKKMDTKKMGVIMQDILVSIDEKAQYFEMNRLNA